MRRRKFFNASYAIVSVIGIALGGYYLLYLRKPVKTEVIENQSKEEENQKEKRQQQQQKPNLEKL